MQVNIASLVEPVLNYENANRDERIGFLAITLYGDGSDATGIAAHISGTQVVKDCFQKVKQNNTSGYQVLCTRLAIYIVEMDEANQEEKSNENDYTSFKVPWNGIMEPFIKKVMD